MERRIRVLIADNSTVIRRLVADALHLDPDFDVYPATHSCDAVDQISQIRPDLVVLDIELPTIGGVEAVRMIRKTNRDLPIIMLCKSLDAKCDNTLAALAAGANDCVTKAMRIGHVGAAIQYIRSQLIPKIRYWTQLHTEPTALFEAEADHGHDSTYKDIAATDTVAVGTSNNRKCAAGAGSNFR